jgi:HpcH/HpaI aldolase/citrate lyase family
MTLPTAALGDTGMQITRVGFGAWAAGGADWWYSWGEQDDDMSVALSAKERARAGAVSGISAAPRTGCLLGVRVNALATGLLPDDVAALGPVWPLLSFVVLPMVPDAATVCTVAAVLAGADVQAGAGAPGPRLIPLVETATVGLGGPRSRLFRQAGHPSGSGRPGAGGVLGQR